MNTLQQLNAGELQGTTHIKLAEGLREFPMALLSLADSLEVLDLSGNQLSQLPAEFAQFHQLKIVFLSNNPFTEVPQVLGECANLEMIGMKSCQIRTVSAKAFPAKLRWLILTDNQISELPDCFDACPRLQKLALAGNQLTHLPPSMATCHNLQLIRISANQLTEFPMVLTQMPSLAWCAFAGNPFCLGDDDPQNAAHELQQAELEAFELQTLLGEGASGHIYLANELASGEQKAVKIFKGAVTSDGYPHEEMRASIRAGEHPNIVKVEAKISGDKAGIVMELIPEHYDNLGLPPCLNSCTRDRFAEDFSLAQRLLLELLRQATRALDHLHQQGIVHGDFYAHNVLMDPLGHLLLGDFGAASHTDFLTAQQTQAMLRIEKRALGHFMEDLWRHADVDEPLQSHLVTWHKGLLSNQIDLPQLMVLIEQQIDFLDDESLE